MMMTLAPKHTVRISQVQVSALPQIVQLRDVFVAVIDSIFQITLPRKLRTLCPL